MLLSMHEIITGNQSSFLKPGEIAYIQNTLRMDPFASVSPETAGLLSRKHLQEQFPLRFRIATDISYDPEKTRKKRTVISALNNLSEFINSPRTNQLFGPQIEVVQSISSHFEQGYLNGYVNLPTGFGKGVILALFAESLGLDCTIVTSRVKLVEELAQTFRRFTEREPGIVHAHAKQTDHNITIGTYNAYRNNKLPQTDILIFDEAHNVLGDKTAEKIKADPALIKLGLTASDEYPENRTVSAVLPVLMHDIRIEQAVQMGLCCSFSVTLAETGIDIANLPSNQQRWGREVNTEAILRTIVELHKTFHPGKKAMVCCNFVPQTEQLTELFREAGIPAGFVHSRQSRQEQNDVIERHRKGELELLSGIKIPGEGHDDPDIDVIYFAGGVGSSVKVIQFAGRALRSNPQKPNKIANIVHVFNPNELGVTYPEAVGSSGEQSPIPAGVISVPNSTYGASIIVRPKDIYSLVNNELISHGLPRILIDEGTWLTESQLRSALSVSHHPKLSRYLDAILSGLTERERNIVVRVKQAGNYRWLSHYHPWLVDKLHQQFEALRNWPEGYNDIYFLAAALQRSKNQLKEEIEQRRAENRIPPFEVKSGERQSGSITKLYPEWIIDQLQDYKKLPPVPEDGVWYSFDQLHAIGIGDRKRFERFISEYNLREIHPDWFGRFSNPSGMNTEYYSSELLDYRAMVIKETAASEVGNRSQWYTVNRIRSELDFSVGPGNNPIETLVDNFQIREQFPEWFQTFSIKNRKYQFYSEELISAALSLRMPESYKTKNSFMVELEEMGVSKYYTRIAINHILNLYPHLQIEFMFSEYNKLSECLSPELMALVKKELKME